jgi:peptide/nickel transport system substrate-binding protein
MLSIRRLSALSAGLLAAVAFASAPVSAQKSGGTLVQITQPEPPNLAPYISTSGPIGR